MTLNTPRPERARKNEQLILQRLASVGQVTAAAAIGVDESTVSRMKEGKIQQFSELLAVLNLKVVPEGMRCFDPKDIDTLLHQAKRWMEHIGSSDQLEFED